ncbi:TonB-dependent receptor [Deminuibacter soli]|uniref:TonB-dependent receptor n=2 Tax=Deminuibacter soli TaxID=2291815 RepID=A0A3E1NMJ8_9BACT|nr:TonB-dependent receptor [Deminuibacter soli]
MAALLVCLAGITTPLLAQETTSDMVGTVSVANKPLAGVSVVAIHTPTGTRYATSTRNDGRFNLPNMRVGGPYTLVVTYVGFREEKQDNIFLTLGQEYKADFALTESSQTLENVVVKGTRQDKVFNNSHTGSQEIISRSQIERLPTVNRSLQDFTRLTPTANGLAFGGQSNQYNNLTVDGANFNNSFGLAGTLGGQTNSQPISLDAIEQIQVNVSPYDVRQGGFSGAGINSVTRSGTNTFKGSVYTYIRGEDLQGYKVRTTTLPHQDYSYNLRGASIGGPIIKNKVFFFVSGESERIKQAATIFTASDATHTPNGVNISNANRDTLARLSDYLAKQYGYVTGPFENYTYETRSDKITAKLDWNINNSNTLTLKYNYLKSSLEKPASNSGSVNSSYGRASGSFALPFKNSGYRQFNNFNIFIAELNTRFSNRSSNKLQVGFTALRDSRAALSSTFPLVDILDGNNQPYTSFGYEQYTYGNKLNTNVYQFSDIFTTYAGSHEITLGTQDSYKTYENGFSPSYNGVYRFASLSDFYGNKPPIRYDLSYTLTKDGSFPLVGPKETELGFFVQDKWRVKPNFTLTYGVRLDIPIFKSNYLYNPVVDTLSKFYGGTHVNTAQAPKTNPLVSPRIGFNWDVFSNQQTQVRGGLGLFAGPPPFVWFSNQASNSGVALFGSISASATPTTSIPYPFNPNVGAYIPPNPSTGLSSSYSINVTDPKFKFPQALKSSLAIDQKLPDNFVVTVEGTYARNVNAVYFQNINMPATGIVLSGADNRTRYTSFTTTPTQIYPLADAPRSVTNPSIGNAIYMKNANKGYAYTATVQIQKTFRNLYTNIAYTYSKSKDIMVGGSTANTMWGSKPVVGDPNQPELGYSNAYLPHRVVASASYRKEYGQHFATSIGALFEAAPSGVNSYVYNGDLNGDNNTSNDLMYIPRNASEILLQPTGATDTRTPAQIWGQLNNFINQDPYLSKHRGEVAQRNAWIYPWYKRLDLNFTQDFYIIMKDKTKHTLRFTLDLYNAGNFLNKNWGIYRVGTISTPLKFEKLGGADGKTPVFSMPYLDAANQIPYTNSFKDDVTAGANTALSSTTGTNGSRWQLQIGFRYLFN